MTVATAVPPKPIAYTARMTTPTPRDLLPDDFDEVLLRLLQQAPAGIDEHSLIKQLALAYPDSLFARQDALRDPLLLFQVHFLLFHQLYRLSDVLVATGKQLTIHPLRVAIESRTVTGAALSVSDPLRDYYMDWSQWAETHAADVQRLLDAFWRGARGMSADVKEALARFGLAEPVEPIAIKQRYRQLVWQHHPDRGGDTADIQQINAAMLILERYYRLR